MTLNTACAKSPWLGVQALLPGQPVTSIANSPMATLPTTKLPSILPVPGTTVHPEFTTMLGLVGLEIKHDPSAVENPVPFTRTVAIGGALAGLSVIDGLVTVKAS